jgi:hypothetical protein
MKGKRHRVNLINRGGYLHEKYRVPPALIAALLAGCERSEPPPRVPAPGMCACVRARVCVCRVQTWGARMGATSALCTHTVGGGEQKHSGVPGKEGGGGGGQNPDPGPPEVGSRCTAFGRRSALFFFTSDTSASNWGSRCFCDLDRQAEARL